MLRRVADAEHPVLPHIVVSQERRARPRLVQIGDANGPAAQRRTQVRGDECGGDVEEWTGSLQIDTEPLANRAVPTVGGDEPIGANSS